MQVNRFLLAVLFAVPGASVAQTGAISGVTLTANGNPLGSVQVTVVGTGLSATTTSSGQFTLDNVPGGTRTIRAMRLGFQTATQQVVVNPGQTAQVTLILGQGAVTALIRTDEPDDSLPTDSLKLPIPDSAVLNRRQSAGSLPFSPQIGQRFQISLFDALVSIEIEQAARTSRGVTAFGWVLSDNGARAGLVTIVVRDNRVTANIRHGLRLYMIRPQPRGVHLIVEVDQSKLPARESESMGGPAL